MSDVNVLLSCAWKNPALLGWLFQVIDWVTSPLTESSFMRISMTTAQATLDDARKPLATLRALRVHRFVSDDVDAVLLLVLSSSRDTTDAHFVTLAKRHGLQLAALDGTLLAKPWAAGVAENPLSQPIKS